MSFLRYLLELSGWDSLTAAEQATAVYGAAVSLAVTLLGLALFGGPGRREQRR
jgi:hypothetical protein